MRCAIVRAPHSQRRARWPPEAMLHFEAPLVHHRGAGVKLVAPDSAPSAGRLPRRQQQHDGIHCHQHLPLTRQRCQRRPPLPLPLQCLCCPEAMHLEGGRGVKALPCLPLFLLHCCFEEALVRYVPVEQATRRVALSGCSCFMARS